MQSARGVSTVRRSVVVPGVAVFCVASMLAGCTSNAEPSPLPSPSPSAASPSPSATPPPLPPEAQGSSAKAAKAFVWHWVDTLNYATETGDTGAIESVSSPKCTSCASASDRIAEVYRAGGSIRSAGWSIRTIGLLPNQPAASPILQVTIDMAPQQVIRKHGAPAKRFKGGLLPATFHLHVTGGTWQVLRLERSA